MRYGYHRFALWAVLCCAACRARAEVPLPADVSREERMIPMRDGVLLATDLYRSGKPEDGGRRLPVLLTRTPYGKRSEALAEQAVYFAQHGYLVAIQDCRGRFGSQGVFTKYAREPEDGYDAVEWLAGLPGSSGQVGMWGTSYMAHVQAA